MSLVLFHEWMKKKDVKYQENRGEEDFHAKQKENCNQLLIFTDW